MATFQTYQQMPFILICKTINKTKEKKLKNTSSFCFNQDFLKITTNSWFIEYTTPSLFFDIILGVLLE